MTVRYGTTDDWENGDILNSTDLLDTFGAIKRVARLNPPVINSCEGIIAHSSTTYSASINNTIYVTTDSGATFTSKNTDPTATVLLRAFKDDITKGFGLTINKTDGETVYTADSGGTWTTKTALTAAQVVPMDMSCPTANLIVVAGTESGGSGERIFRSTDQGGTWALATTSPTTDLYCVDMWDSSTGYAIDLNKNVWKTTDGGDTWADTTHNVNTSTTTGMSMRTLSATTAIIAGSGSIDAYNNSTGVSTQKFIFSSLDNTSGIIATDNYLYISYFDANVQGAGIHVFKSDDSGATWDESMQFLSLSPTSGEDSKAGLSSITDDTFLLCQGGNSILKIADK